MKPAIGIRQFLDRKFDAFEFDGKFRDSFGLPEKNFRMIIYGHPGNGKTEFSLQLAKYLARFRKVYYNSYEQGISKSLQDAVRRNKMEEVAGNLIFGDGETFTEMMERLSSRSAPQIVFIDSRDYMNLTSHQFKQLIDEHPRKAFIVICWEAGGKPKGEHGKAIEYMADIKVHVEKFRAHPRCRFGGNQPYIIWDKKAQNTLF